MKTDPVIDARKANLFLMGGAVIPGFSCYSASPPGESRGPAHLLYEETPDLALLAILDLSCPNDKQASDGGIRDPSLGPVQCITLFGLDCSGFHG